MVEETNERYFLINLSANNVDSMSPFSKLCKSNYGGSYIEKSIHKFSYMSLKTRFDLQGC